MTPEDNQSTTGLHDRQNRYFRTAKGRETMKRWRTSDKGRAWWAQNTNWGYQSVGMAQPTVGDSKWFASDFLGQREFTRAMARWLDGEAVHDNCLDNAVRGFNVIMALMQSAYDGKILQYPAKVDADIKEKLQARLERAG